MMMIDDTILVWCQLWECYNWYPTADTSDVDKKVLNIFLGGDTPSLFPNPLCSLKVATLVSTIPHVR